MEAGVKPFVRWSYHHCPSFREGELGSLVLGDWIQLISPTMRDLSATSWKWWEEVLQLAMTAYREWLTSGTSAETSHQDAGAHGV